MYTRCIIFRIYFRFWVGFRTNWIGLCLPRLTRGYDPTSSTVNKKRACEEEPVLVELTVVSDGLGGPLLGLSILFLVLGLPGVVDLQSAVKLLPACSQQLDIYRNNRLLSTRISSYMVVPSCLPPFVHQYQKC